jgi:hypothetical protein
VESVKAGFKPVILQTQEEDGDPDGQSTHVERCKQSFAPEAAKSRPEVKGQHGTRRANAMPLGIQLIVSWLGKVALDNLYGSGHRLTGHGS